jgi:hypothetical protein
MRGSASTPAQSEDLIFVHPAGPEDKGAAEAHGKREGQSQVGRHTKASQRQDGPLLATSERAAAPSGPPAAPLGISRGPPRLWLAARCPRWEQPAHSLGAQGRRAGMHRTGGMLAMGQSVHCMLAGPPEPLQRTPTIFFFLHSASQKNRGARLLGSGIQEGVFPKDADPFVSHCTLGPEKKQAGLSGW